ncbi:hypothetical protein JHL17_25315 [Azospirillum sp. YIM B02556]|uniref:Glycosyltransferase family 9 (Heptosyltransferase) n=1 Tax=Azospirillum endophyticum TaxID=2800326 RepID=A0ABS1FBD3_9PROT|nr:hypothetical protein [Azospirillum endophyticum]MBK1840729.1 hypothetical protein [Azospirillum endophyticum]
MTMPVSANLRSVPLATLDEALRAALRGDTARLHELCSLHPDSADFRHLAELSAAGRVALASPHHALERAWEHHGGERLLLARVAYQTALAVAPANREALSGLGILRMRFNDIPGSLTALTRAANLLGPTLQAADLHQTDRELEIRFGILAARALSTLADMINTAADVATVLSRLALPFRHAAGFYRELGMLVARRAVERMKEGDPIQAVALGRLSVILEPGLPEAYSNLGYASEMAGCYPQAYRPYLRGALANTDPSRRAYAYLMLKHLCFRLGLWDQFADLLPHKRNYGPLTWWNTLHPAPLWDGALKPGTSILIYAESGFGDVIQCIRYADYFQAHGMEVHVACDRRLVSLCRLVPGVTTVQAPPCRIGNVDWRVWSFDLFYMIERDPVRTFKAEGYLDLARGPEVGPVLERRPGELLVGIKWTTTDPAKDLPLDAFARLRVHPGIRFVSLQPEPPPAASILTVERPLDGFFGDAEDSFLATAQVIGQLDLVITADSVITHLAGALGVETWVALKAVPDWRWMVERDDSPLYDSLTLFRQPLGETSWDSVFDALEAVMRQRLVAEA